MWAHGEQRGIGLCHSATTDDGMRVLDVGTSAKDAEQRALQDERFRILYVALTRAIHACHVYALSPDRPARSNGSTSAQGTARSALDVMLARLSVPPDSAQWQHIAANIRWGDGWQCAWAARSEEGRVGKGGGRTGKSRG